MNPRIQRFSLAFALLAAAALACLSQAEAQISVAPTTVIMEGRNPFGEFLVANRSNIAQEISIDFEFGFPASDEDGEAYMEYEKVERGAPYDLSSRVRAFPRSFVLPAGEQQTVRLMVRPAAEMPDGVYWTRMVTTSNPREQDIEAQQVREDVSARIIFRVRQVTTVLFKRGDVNTGVKVNRLDAYAEEENLIVEAEMEREGNAPFIGRSFLKVFNEEGEVLYEHDQNVSLYFDLFRRIAAPLEDFPDGSYRAELSFRAERRDIPPAELVPMEAVSHSATFTLPGAKRPKETGIDECLPPELHQPSPDDDTD